MSTSLPGLFKSRHTAWITHSILAVLTFALFTLLVHLSYRVAFVPGVLIAHRIGVLLHEYFHGIPFRRYRNNLTVVSFFDGLLLMFRMLELFRGTHLAHHRWLNTEQDSAVETATRATRRNNRLMDLLALTEVVQHFIYLRDALSGKKSYIRGRRLVLGVALSLLTIVAWRVIGHPEIVWKTIAITIFTSLVPVSLRGAIEHHSFQGDSNFANEYKVWIPLFNLNKHIHHHENPTLPWYLLEFRTPHPLSHWNYFTYWFRVYLNRTYVLMKPMR